MIRWSDIEAECQGFRQGLVATFRKYEGEPTDEKDAQGRTVKVTAHSFARHVGVAESTFKEWVRKVREDERGLPASPVPRDRGALVRDVRRAARSHPDAVVEAVAELPEETQDTILRELHQKKLERAGADFSTSHRKASEAATAEFLEPVRDALKAMKSVTRAVAVLESAATEIRNLPGDLSDEERREVDAAVDDVVLARTEMHMRSEVER